MITHTSSVPATWCNLAGLRGEGARVHLTRVVHHATAKIKQIMLVYRNRFGDQLYGTRRVVLTRKFFPIAIGIGRGCDLAVDLVRLTIASLASYIPIL